MASEHVAEYIEDPNGWWYVTCQPCATRYGRWASVSAPEETDR